MNMAEPGRCVVDTQISRERKAQENAALPRRSGQPVISCEYHAWYFVLCGENRSGPTGRRTANGHFSTLFHKWTGMGRRTTDHTDDTDRSEGKMNKELIHKELSESIIGAAMSVLNGLRPGLDEKLYERALVIALLLNFKNARLEWKRIVN